jgi:hypothetical protein
MAGSIVEGGKTIGLQKIGGAFAASIIEQLVAFSAFWVLNL